MQAASPPIWRLLFVAGGLLYFVGAFFHPRGTSMSEMLVDPAWVPSHAGVLTGFALVTAGLYAFRRAVPASPALNRWLGWTLALAMVQLVEMGLHALAFTDAAALPSGSLHGGWSTPVLTTHLWLSTLAFTPFAVALIGLIVVGQRERSLGSPWIGWLGMLGAAAYGSVMWLVFVLGVDGAGVLFPIAHLAVPLWFMLAGVWPVRQGSGVPGPAQPAGTAAALHSRA